MKLTEYKREVTEQGTLSENMFGISQDDQVHIISILRSKLYSNKPLALLREYTANAQDANVEAGFPDRPIKVHIPTKFEPVLSVRDFGLGLSRQDVYEVYCQYGKSTKRNSNSVVGQLGLGSKSAFCYADSFVIISYHQGMRTSYCAFIDESGIGKISELESVSSDEESGVEIQVAVALTDINLFRTEATKLFGYFNPTPEINIDLTVPVYIARGKTWGIRQPNSISGPMAIMGNISYPITGAKINLVDTGKDFSELQSLLNSNIDIFCEIGDLSITASRETLEYTTTTQDSIKKILLQIHNEMAAEIAKQFDLITTIWDARLWYRAGIGYHNRSHWGRAATPLSSIILNRFPSWRGINIAEQTIQWADNCGDKISVRYLDHSRFKPTSGADGRMHRGRYWKTVAHDKLVLLKVDTTNWSQRFLHYRKDRDLDAIVIDYLSKDKTEADFDSQIAAYCVANNIVGIPILKTSDMELPVEVPVTVTSARKSASSDKAKLKIFKVKPDYSAFRYPNSDNWDTCEVDLENEAGVYLTLFKFLPVKDDLSDDQEQIDLLTILFTLGFDNSIPIYGIRKELKSSLTDQWIPFTDWAKKEIASLLASKTEVRTNILNYYVTNNYRCQAGFKAGSELSWKEFTDLCLDPRVSTAALLYKASMAATETKGYVNYSNIFHKIQNKDIIQDIIKEASIYEDLTNDYPLLLDLRAFHGGTVHLGNNWPKTLSQYINMLYKEKLNATNDNNSELDNCSLS